MASNKKKANLAAKKAKKQKTILAVCGVLFLVVMVIQGPRMYKLVRGDSGPTAAPYKAFPDAAPTAAPVAISQAGGVVLQDRDQQPEASEGQLVDFELFPSKDPFAQQVTLPDGGESSDSGSGDADKGEAGGDETQQGGEQEESPTSADISVNGSAESVQVGAEFPTADPAFVLVSASKGSVRIGIAGGSLATGSDTVTLQRGKTLTLVNTVDGTEYRLRLVSIS
jgi:hypothetical protein